MAQTVSRSYNVINRLENITVNGLSYANMHRLETRRARAVS